MKLLFHTVALLIEWLVLVSVVFWGVTATLDIAPRVYTDAPSELSFRIRQGQEEPLGDLDYYRVDYTTKARRQADDDSDFIASQMIRVKPDAQDPFRPYRVTLPRGVLKVRIDTHYLPGRERDHGVELADVVWDGRCLNVTQFDDYYNRRFSFYGKCYVPRPFMNGYYVEYLLFSLLSVLVFLVCWRRYWRVTHENP